MERFKNKKIAVLGFGIEGKSVVDFLTDSEITVFDEKLLPLTDVSRAPDLFYTPI